MWHLLYLFQLNTILFVFPKGHKIVVLISYLNQNRNVWVKAREIPLASACDCQNVGWAGELLKRKGRLWLVLDPLCVHEGGKLCIHKTHKKNISVEKNYLFSTFICNKSFLMIFEELGDKLQSLVEVFRIHSHLA